MSDMAKARASIDNVILAMKGAVIKMTNLKMEVEFNSGPSSFTTDKKNFKKVVLTTDGVTDDMSDEDKNMYYYNRFMMIGLAVQSEQFPVDLLNSLYFNRYIPKNIKEAITRNPNFAA